MQWWMFYLLVAAGITALIFVVVLPLLYRSSRHQIDVLNNVQIVKQRLAELEREASEGLISEHDKRQAADELKLALVDEMSAGKTASKGFKIPLLVGAVIALAVAVVVYSDVNQLGAIGKSEQAVAQLPELRERLANGDGGISGADIRDLTLAIRTRLHQQPDDVTGWFYLGRLWQASGQFEQSILAFERALRLKPEARDVQISLAQSLMSTGDLDQMKRAFNVLAKVAEQDPDNVNVLMMMTVLALELDNTAQAEHYFAQLETRVDAANPLFVELRQRLNANGVVTDSTSAPQPDTGFSVTITINDSLASKIPHNGYLFLFAQDAAGQSKMPAAVVRVALSEWPMTLSLTQENAMTPSFTLNQLAEARVVARISPDDQVPAQPGDLEGSVTVEVVQGQTQSISLTIDEELM